MQRLLRRHQGSFRPKSFEWLSSKGADREDHALIGGNNAQGALVLVSSARTSGAEPGNSPDSVFWLPLRSRVTHAEGFPVPGPELTPVTTYRVLPAQMKMRMIPCHCEQTNQPTHTHLIQRAFLQKRVLFLAWCQITCPGLCAELCPGFVSHDRM